MGEIDLSKIFSKIICKNCKHIKTKVLDGDWENKLNEVLNET